MTEELKKEQNSEDVETTVAEEETAKKAEVESEEDEKEETVAEEVTAEEEEVKTDTQTDTASEESTETEESEEETVYIPTFTGDVEGETYTFDQLQAASDDYTDDEFHQLAGMYENTLSEIEEKEIVTGIVVSVDEKYVIVDIGFKSEGIVPVNEFSDKVIENLQPGDEVEVFLDRVEDREGQLILSRKKADILQAWENLEKAHETGEVIEGLYSAELKEEWLWMCSELMHSCPGRR
jgi:small subunit ribosomal protein S1